MKKRNYILPMCFFLCLILGFVSYFVSQQREFSADENRYLTMRPSFRLDTLLSGEFTEQMDSYASDQFVLRSAAITVKTQIQKLAGVKDSNGVYFGKDGCLMLKKSPSEFDGTRFGKNLSAVKSFADMHESMPIKVMLVPTASYVWSEKLPSGASDYDQADVLEQAAKEFSESSNVEMVDVAGQLLAHKDEDLYYRTDHHWTSLGAYYGYLALCESEGWQQPAYQSEVVTESFYGTLYSKVLAAGTKPDRIERYTGGGDVKEVSHGFGKTVTDTIYEESKLKEKDKYQYFLGGNDSEVTIRTKVKNGRHLLLIKDSYANCFVQYLTSEYETIHLIDLRYFSENLSAYMEREGITEALFLYNLNNFDEDSSLIKVRMP